MSNPKICKLRDWIAHTNPQYFCLAAALGLEFLLMAFRGYGFYFMENYMIVPTMLFLGMAFGKKYNTTARCQLFLSLGMVFWFFITQTFHYMMDMDVRSVGLITSVYLLAFLFASFTQDGEKQWGIKLAAAACIGAASMIVLFTCLLALGKLPGFLVPHVYWDGARLQAMWHPNICAIILMMGMAFCLVLFSQAKRKWCKGLCLVGVAAFFLTMALTNSRTSIMMACCILGGFLFFCIYNGSWKRFLIGAVVAAAAIGLFFGIAHTIFQAHSDAKVAKFMEQAEAAAQNGEAAVPSSGDTATYVYRDINTGKIVLETDAGQTSVAAGLPSLNGRTDVWRAVFQILRETPSVSLIGVDYSEKPLANLVHFGPAHAHNAWLETLMCLGIPGLLFALVFTVIAAWHIWVTFWGKNTTLGQKTVAMLALCLMGASILEPYLFFTSVFYHYTDFLFFLCLGYLVHWRSEARK